MASKESFGPPPSPEAREFVLAEQFLTIAEEAGDLVEELRESLLKGSLTKSQISHAASEVRRTVFLKACDVLRLSKRSRHFALFREVPDEEVDGVGGDQRIR